MEKQINFIGGGNMGRAMLDGILKAGVVTADRVMVSDKSKEALSYLEKTYGVQVTEDNTAAAKSADILFLAVKPQFVYGVIDEIKDALPSDTLVISIVAGQSIESLEHAFGKKLRLIRVMPNTSALVGEAMSALSPNETASEEDLNLAKILTDCFGKSEVVPEGLMDAVTGVSGSSPAYVYLFIEAMADAAVADGMPRAQAYTFAAQAVLGAAKMVLESGKHPGELKDMVCSPGGTTIEAVASLEASGFRGAVIKAQRECVKRSREL